MNTTRIDKLLAGTVNLREQTFTDKEAEYFYKYINPTHIDTLTYGYYNTQAIDIIEKLLKYDNVYLKYNTNKLYTLLSNMKFDNEYFEMLFDRYIALKNDEDYNITMSFVNVLHYNVDFFIKKWDMLRRLLLNEHNYKSAIHTIFSLMKSAKNEQMPVLNDIFNEMLSAFYAEHQFSVQNLCKDYIIDNIIVDKIIDITLLDIPEWCIPNEDVAYKEVKGRWSFVRFLNVYNKYWDKKKAIKEITTKMKHVKITQKHFTVPQMYQFILSEVKFADMEVYDELKKRYNRAIAKA